MQLLETHTIPYPTGDKYLLLYHGDLSAIPSSEAVDVLVVSAFPDDYIPTPSSLIGALHRKGISVADLSADKEVDLRTSFSSWLSRDLHRTSPTAGFRRILCFESARRGAPAERVSDIFRAIMPFALSEPPIRSIAMPILAAGDQGHDAAAMLKSIFEASTHWLAAGLPIHAVKLVIHDASNIPRLRHVFASLSHARDTSPPSASARSNEGTRYHVFVSYSHEDAPAADELVRALQSANPKLTVFQDKLELCVGESWQAELDRALESCRTVIAIYSPAYLSSNMCLEEFNMARVRHRDSPKPVLTPIYLRTAPLPLYMRTLHYLDCREANRERLISAARQLAGI